MWIKFFIVEFLGQIEQFYKTQAYLILYIEQLIVHLLHQSINHVA